jgi:hypothetical protein
MQDGKFFYPLLKDTDWQSFRSHQYH